MRGNARSSANRVAPVTFATASTFRSAFPIIRRSDGLTAGRFDAFLQAIKRFSSWFSPFPAHACRGQLYRLIDLDVAGATAEVARQSVLDFVAGRLGIGDE